ncbi:MAG: hypothetical protein K6E73_08470 [Bacteroidales bacterium]|nr:hypothetical protein [Bacteroidales bacterium]
MLKNFFLTFSALCFVVANAQQVDFSVGSVPEEGNMTFKQITTSNDHVCMPEIRRSRNSISWYSNRIIGVSPDGSRIAFLSAQENTSNIFVKGIDGSSPSVQRTKRQTVLDFAYSTDGKYLVFSERYGKNSQVFQTDANAGFVCRQITSGANDFTPVFSYDMTRIFFARQDKNGQSVWSYDVASNFLSTYTTGMNPYPLPDSVSFLCVRTGAMGQGEIWRINFQSGIEECIVSDANRSFTTPMISPDGQWILMVGETNIITPTFNYRNTDIFVCRIDGSQLTQLTYHAADDISPVWDNEGKYIYFISQRGSQAGDANIWRMEFNPPQQ